MGAKILVSCANGAGSSLMMKLAVEKATKELSMDVEKIHHCSIAEGKSSAQNYDIVFCPLNFINMFDSAEKKGVCVFGMRNVMSKDEAISKLRESGIAEKYQA